MRGRALIPALAAVILLAGCSPMGSSTTAPVPAPTRARVSSGSTTVVSHSTARQHLTALADGIGARPPGSPQEARAAAYVREQLERSGYAVETQPFEFRSSRSTATSANLQAVKAGAVAEEIVVGAHYDSVDDGEGADDNASGVATLLALAEQLRGVDTHYTIRFIAFGAEEANDLYGSQHAVAQLDAVERDRIHAMINLDSLVSGDIAYAYSDAAPLLDWTVRAATEAGFDLQTRSVRDLHDDSDYYSYQSVGIPFLYFEATNWNLGDRDGFTRVDPRYGDNGEIIHTSYDRLSYLDSTFPGRVDHYLSLYGTLLYAIATQYR